MGFVTDDRRDFEDTFGPFEDARVTSDAANQRPRLWLSQYRFSHGTLAKTPVLRRIRLGVGLDEVRRYEMTWLCRSQSDRIDLELKCLLGNWLGCSCLKMRLQLQTVLFSLGMLYLQHQRLTLVPIIKLGAAK